MQEVKIQNLVLNVLTQEQFEGAEKDASQLYLTPDTSIDSAEKGAANGVASLDANAKVPTEQLPVATTSTIGGVKPDGTTITVTEDGVISASISGEGVATKADLQHKINKAGDTMTGPLKMSGANEVRFGTDDNFYSVHQEASSQYLTLYNKNGRGLLINGNQNGIMYYFDGTNVFRLLTTADLESLQTQINSLNTEVTGMLGRMNFNARVDFMLSHGQSYTVPSKGYLWINAVGGTSNGGNAYINGSLLAGGRDNDSSGSSYVRAFVPVSAGDVLNAVRTDNNSTVYVAGFFVPQI